MQYYISMKTLLSIIAILFLVWVAYGYLASQSKEPKFTVLEKKAGYEIREYAPYIEARVTVSGTYHEAQNNGFRILAGYIFGGNTSKTSIAMTVPVLEQKSESIAMTAPVMEALTDTGERVVSFVMPEEYTLATLPTPNDRSIEIVEVPAHKSAVLRYTWNTTAERVEQKKSELLSYIKRDGLVSIGVPRGARYNPPWTPPFMMRNEVLVDIIK